MLVVIVVIALVGFTGTSTGSVVVRPLGTMVVRPLCRTRCASLCAQSIIMHNCQHIHRASLQPGLSNPREI